MDNNIKKQVLNYLTSLYPEIKEKLFDDIINGNNIDSSIINDYILEVIKVVIPAIEAYGLSELNLNGSLVLSSDNIKQFLLGEKKYNVNYNFQISFEEVIE